MLNNNHSLIHKTVCMLMAYIKHGTVTF